MAKTKKINNQRFCDLLPKRLSLNENIAISNDDTFDRYYQDYQHNNHEHLWTTMEVSTYLRIKPSIIRYWVQCASIPFIKLGRQIRFDPIDIKNWINNQKNGNFSIPEKFKKII